MLDDQSAEDPRVEFERMRDELRSDQAKYRARQHQAFDEMLDEVDAREMARLVALDDPVHPYVERTAKEVMEARRRQIHAALDAGFDRAIERSELQLEVMRRKAHGLPIH